MKRNALLGLVFALLIVLVAVWVFLGSDDASDRATDGTRGARDLVGALPPASDDGKTAEVAAASDEPKDESTEEEDEVAERQPLLLGRVLGEGAGIADATLRFYSVEEAERFFLGLAGIVPQGGEMPNIPVLIGKLKAALAKFRDMGIPVTTDENGEFALYEAKPGAYFVLTFARGWIFHFGDVVSLALGETRELTIELDRGSTISGSVVSPAGVSVAGATVVAEYRPPGMPGVGKIVRRGLKMINGEFLKGPFEAQTDAAGNFLLDSLPPGVYDLAASVPSGVESRLELVQTGTSGAVVVLGAGATLHGFLADSDELPVGGIEIRLEHMGDRIQLPMIAAGFSDIANTVNRFLGEPPRTATSAGNGGFVFRGLGEGKYQLSIEQPGFLRLLRQVEVVWGETQDLGGLTIDRGQTIRGIVRTEEGEPIEGASIIASKSKMTFLNAGIGINDLATARLQTRSDENGVFLLGGLRRSKYRISATRAGYAPASAKDVTGDSEPLDLVLRPGMTIKGKIVLAGTEDGVAGAMVRARQTRTTTDENGVFVLEGVTLSDPGAGFPFQGGEEFSRRGRGRGRGASARRGAEGDEARSEEDPEEAARRARLIRVYAEGKGYLGGRAELDSEELPEEVVIEVKKSPSIEGIVLDPEGEPAPGSVVRLTPSFPRQFEDMGFFDTSMIFLGITVSDREGKFQFENFYSRDGGRLRVVADHVLYARGQSETFRFDAEFDTAEGVEVQLVSGSTIKGVVTDGKEPIAGATVRLARYRESEGRGGEQMFMKMLGLPKGGDTVHTNSDGEFLYSQVVPGDYVVSAEVQGFTESTEERVTLEAADERVLAFEMDPGASIFGQVVDVAGDPVGGARVRILRGSENATRTTEAQKFYGGSYKSTVSGDDGSFVLEGLPAGSYIVLGDKKEYRRVEIADVEPTDQPLTLVLVRSAFIRGSVADTATGAPVTSFRVEVKNTDEEADRGSRSPWGRRRQYSDPDGVFERGDLAPGVYRVEVSASGFLPSALKIELAEGSIAEPAFALTRSGRIEGRIVDKLTGQPLAGASVRLAARVAVAAAAPAGDGERKSGVPRVGDDETSAPQKTEEELRSEDMNALRQRYYSRASGGTVESEGDGSFVFDTVPEGPQVLIVSHPGYMQLERPGVEVGLGGLLTVELGLEAGLHVAGEVRDAAGAPADGHTVFIRGVSPGNSRVGKSVRVDGSGNFRIHGLEKGAYRIFPYRGGRGFRRGPAQSLQLESSRTDISLSMPAVADQ